MLETTVRVLKKDNPNKSGFDLDTIVLPDMESRQAPQKAKLKKISQVDPEIIIKLIFKKIKKNDSFLAFTSQINEVNKILQMKYASANDIAQAILNDISLTSKLLKLVNSSYYGHFSSNGISTISEAMIIVGTDQIKFLAASLKLIELMQNIGDSNLLKEKTLKSIQRSIVAGQIASKGGFVSSEKLQVSSILYDFGEYLVTAFAPDTCQKIITYKEQRKLDLEQASRTLIGISYRDLGLVVAKKWNMPKTVTDSMKPITNFGVKKTELNPEDLVPYVCAFSNSLCEINLNEPRDDVEQKMKKIQSLYTGLFDMPVETLVDIIRLSEEKIAAHAAVMKIAPKTKKTKTNPCIKDKKLIENGIKGIKQTLKKGFTIQNIFENTLNCLHEGFHFSNVIFCIKNKQAGTMNPRYVLGEKKEHFLKNFKFKIIKTGDLFNQSLHSESIIIVNNIEADEYKAKIPLWYKENRFSDAFAVVPIGLKNNIISMLYLDWNPDQVIICNETRSYLETFRELVISALKGKR